jgi:hypothetical protein
MAVGTLSGMLGRAVTYSAYDDESFDDAEDDATMSSRRLGDCNVTRPRTKNSPSSLLSSSSIIGRAAAEDAVIGPPTLPLSDSRYVDAKADDITIASRQRRREIDTTARQFPSTSIPDLSSFVLSSRHCRRPRRR